MDDRNGKNRNGARDSGENSGNVIKFPGNYSRAYDDQNTGDEMRARRAGRTSTRRPREATDDNIYVGNTGKIKTHFAEEGVYKPSEPSFVPNNVFKGYDKDKHSASDENFTDTQPRTRIYSPRKEDRREPDIRIVSRPEQKTTIRREPSQAIGEGEEGERRGSVTTIKSTRVPQGKNNTTTYKRMGGAGRNQEYDYDELIDVSKSFAEAPRESKQTITRVIQNKEPENLYLTKKKKAENPFTDEKGIRKQNSEPMMSREVNTTPQRKKATPQRDNSTNKVQARSEYVSDRLRESTKQVSPIKKRTEEIHSVGAKTSRSTRQTVEAEERTSKKGEYVEQKRKESREQSRKNSVTNRVAAAPAKPRYDRKTPVKVAEKDDRFTPSKRRSILPQVLGSAQTKNKPIANRKDRIADRKKLEEARDKFISTSRNGAERQAKAKARRAQSRGVSGLWNTAMNVPLEFDLPTVGGRTIFQFMFRCIVAAAICVTAFAICVLSARLLCSVRSIKVYGNSDYNSADIISYSQLQKGMCMFDISEADVEKRIAERNPYLIADVKVAWLDKVKITVSTRKAYAAIACNNQYVIIDSELIALEFIPQNELSNYDIIIVEGMQAKSFQLSEKIGDEKINPHVNDLYAILAAIESHELEFKVKSIDVLNSNMLSFVTDGGLTVLLGDSSNIDEKLDRVCSLSSTLAKNGLKAGTLDVRGDGTYKKADKETSVVPPMGGSDTAATASPEPDTPKPTTTQTDEPKETPNPSDSETSEPTRTPASSKTPTPTETPEETATPTQTPESVPTDEIPESMEP